MSRVAYVSKVRKRRRALIDRQLRLNHRDRQQLKTHKECIERLEDDLKYITPILTLFFTSIVFALLFNLTSYIVIVIAMLITACLSMYLLRRYNVKIHKWMYPKKHALYRLYVSGRKKFKYISLD